MYGSEVDTAAPPPVAELSTLTTEDETLKRPPNAFILFYRAVHAAVLTEHLELADLEVNRLIGRMWRATDDQTRGYWRDRARTLADLFRTVHPDWEELKHKKANCKTASVRLPEPIRLKVILLDHDIRLGTPTPPTQVEMFE
jgi:hypothetical protein